MITQAPRHHTVSRSWHLFYRNKRLNPIPDRIAVKAVRESRSIKNVLDLGCANCNEARYFLENGADRVVGIDNCPLAIAPSRSLERDYGHRFEFRDADFRDWSYGENRFDLVFANGSLPFLSPADIKDVLNKIILSLRDGGTFVGTLLGDMHWARGRKPEFTFLSQAELALMLFGLDVRIEKDEQMEPEGLKQRLIVIARRSDESL